MFISHCVATHLALLALVLGIAHAESVPTKTVGRAQPSCETVEPELYILNSSLPDTIIEGSKFMIQRTWDGKNNYINSLITAMTFTNIPQTATGCTLKLTIPSITIESMLGEGPATLFGVWSTEPWTRLSREAPTYARRPLFGELLSTIDLPTQVTSDQMEAIIATNICSETMSFWMEHINWQPAEGWVHWQHGNNSIGFRLVYNCF
ncbi:hypothetical protein AJ78_05610 [Emergomyces pasteurianus Ep9510]|uniref:Ubiquitin 3 binding protein But2 C-terminal domain-containing protein n=1 Tax=Emergomyces pasteurianus Ep9510 TaxID=1447872 RepID=A0A1J9QFN7_9EURO|nr:hypothetical protein AJ78_05610 [Emergomyces pasteurianus Ep9510]